MCPMPFIWAFFCPSVRFDLFPLLLIIGYSLNHSLTCCVWPKFLLSTLDFISAPSLFWIPHNKLYSVTPITLWIALVIPVRSTLCPDSVLRTGYPVTLLSAGDQPLPVCFAIILIKRLQRNYSWLCLVPQTHRPDTTPINKWNTFHNFTCYLFLLKSRLASYL